MSSSATANTVAIQAPLPTRFPKQEYWSGLPLPSPRDLLDPGIEPTSPASAGGFFTTEPPGKCCMMLDRKCLGFNKGLCLRQIFTVFLFLISLSLREMRKTSA